MNKNKSKPNHIQGIPETKNVNAAQRYPTKIVATNSFRKKPINKHTEIEYGWNQFESIEKFEDSIPEYFLSSNIDHLS